MFANLKTALHQKGITEKQYAEFLGVEEGSVRRKLKGVTDFTYLEFQKTCNLLLPEYKADYLFEESAAAENQSV